MGKIIGIDLGTTNSCVAVLEGVGASGEPEVKVVPNADGARTTPSVVAVAAGGERLVGQVAKRQATTNPENTVYAVKRLMGRKFDEPEVQKQVASVPYHIVRHENGDAWVDLRGKKTSPPEVSAMVLGAMKQIAETYLGESVTDAIVTVPAYFDDAQRQATKDAGTIAGLEIKRILNEPTAAALAYGMDKKAAERIAVYDLGGGTFDISILEIAGGVFSVKATGGDTHLGGEDFDIRIIDKLADEFKAAHSIDLRQDRMGLQRLREAAEKAKHELSSSLETEVNVPFIASGSSGPLHLERSMKRSELEILTADLVERTIISCKAVLADAKTKAANVDQVVLVGGMTRMPAVQKAVKEFFGKDPNKGVNPDEVVAVGAAIQGAALGGQIDEVLLLDVTPLSIGVETGGGVFTRLIARNTTVPTEKSEVFTTSVDNQPFVPIHVMQGEREMAVDNRSLAKFELTGIPPAPRGVPKIQVTFRIDANGILSVEAKDLGTGRTQAVSVRPTSGLNEAEVSKFVADAEKFKETDELRKELAELRNQAETLIYTTEQALEGYGDLISPEKLAGMRADLSSLKESLRAAPIFRDEKVRVHARELLGADEVAVTFERLLGRVDQGLGLISELCELLRSSSISLNFSASATSFETSASFRPLVADAEKFKETDELRKELAELRNQAETLIYTTEQALEGYGDLISPEKLAGMHADLSSLKESLESGSDLQAIRDAYARLEAATFQIAEAMYGTDGGSAGSDPAGA